MCTSLRLFGSFVSIIGGDPPPRLKGEELTLDLNYRVGGFLFLYPYLFNIEILSLWTVSMMDLVY